jgi:GNAT superfamily N-acetyltransferase
MYTYDHTITHATSNLYGTVSYNLRDNEPMIIGVLFVHPSSRRQGLGTQLIQICLNINQQQTTPRPVVLYVNKHHRETTWLVNFYEKLGFRDTTDPVTAARLGVPFTPTAEHLMLYEPSPM